MVLFGDEVLVEAHFGQVAPNVRVARKSFLTHTMDLLGDVGHVESRFGLFGDNVSLGAR
jgi:hypothetical protein